MEEAWPAEIAFAGERTFGNTEFPLTVAVRAHVGIGQLVEDRVAGHRDFGHGHSPLILMRARSSSLASFGSPVPAFQFPSNRSAASTSGANSTSMVAANPARNASVAGLGL